MATFHMDGDSDLDDRNLYRKKRKRGPAVDLSVGVPSRLLEPKPKKPKRFNKQLVTYNVPSDAVIENDWRKYDNAIGHLLVRGFPGDTSCSKLLDTFSMSNAILVDKSEDNRISRICFGSKGKPSFDFFARSFVFHDQILVEHSEAFFYEEENELFSMVPIHYSEIIKKIIESASFDEQVEFLRKKVLMAPEDLKRRAMMVDYFRAHQQFAGIEGELYILGSSANGVGFKDSDLDLFLHLSSVLAENQIMCRKEAVDHLAMIFAGVQNIFRMKINRPINARTPVIKWDFSHKKGIKNGLKVDLTVTSFLGVHNSKLIKFLCDQEPLFRDLALILKFWAKLNRITETFEMTSYALILMVMFYCQTRELLPSVESLQNHNEPVMYIQNKLDETFHRVDFSTEDLEPVEQKPLLSELLIGFFYFYEEFDYSRFVISPFYGKVVAKNEFNARHLAYGRTSIACIQDFFELGKNLAERPSFLSKFRSKVHSMHQKLVNYKSQVSSNPNLIMKLMFEEIIGRP